MESIYRSAPIVANICIYASPTEMKPIAIIVPVDITLQQLARSIIISAVNDSNDSKLRAIILSQLLAVGKLAGLANFELVQSVVLSTEEWTTENVSTASPLRESMNDIGFRA